MKNQPYNVLRHTQRDRAPNDPVTLFTFATQTLGFSTLGAIAFAAAGFIAITVVTSWALRALMPKPSFGGASSAGILVNAREPDAAHQFVYGEIRKGGTLTFAETTGETNKYLHMIIALAGHPVNQIGDIYIDDQIVTWDQATGNVTDAFLDEDGNPLIRIQKFDGTQTTAPSDLLNESELTGDDALTANFVGNGIAYLYVRMEYNQSAFPNGIPLFTAVVQGKKVYDPRTETTAYSNNAALCIRDYLTTGYGLLDDKIDDTSFSAAANICDETVSLAAGGAQKRYVTNGVISANTPHGDALSDMVTSCAGTLFWGAGNWKLTVADYVAPTKTLTLDDLRSSISVQTRNNLRDQFNIVQGTFINGDQDWITQDYPPFTNAAFVTEDGGTAQHLDLPLPFTTSSATAQRLAKLTLYRGREQTVLSAEFGMNAFDVEVGEIIQLDIDRYGWANKEFEVIGWQLKPSSDGGDLRVALTLHETSSDAFAWNQEEDQIIGGTTNLPNASNGLTINNLTATGGGQTQGDGTFINSVIVDWTDVTNAFLDYYEVEWKPLADSVYNSTTTEQSGIELSPLIDGVEYIIRVRAVTVDGVRGDYASVQFTGGGDETGPSLPTGVEAIGGFEYIKLKWTNPADTDLSYIEIWESEDTSFSNASKIAIATGDTFVRTNLGINTTRHYWLRAFDFSGNGSEDEFGQPIYTAREQATTTFIDDNDFENGVYSLFTGQGLYAIEDVQGLPVSGDFTGQKVFNRVDGKLYQWNEAGDGSWGQISPELVVRNTDVAAPRQNQYVRNLDEDKIYKFVGAEFIEQTLFSTYTSLPTTSVEDRLIRVTKADRYHFYEAIATGQFQQLNVTYGTASATSITNPYDGQYYYETDTDTLSVYDLDTTSWSTVTFSGVTDLDLAVSSGVYRLQAYDYYVGGADGWGLVVTDSGVISGDKIVANTITGGLLATSGIITNSAQIEDAVVTNAKIENLAVTTIKVADRAITSQTSTSISSASTTSTAYTTLATLSFNAQSANEQVLVGGFFEMFINNNSDGDRGGNFRLLFNGSVLKDYSFGSSGVNQRGDFAVLFSELTVSGTNTLTAQARVSGSSTTATMSNGSLVSLEALK